MVMQDLAEPGTVTVNRRTTARDADGAIGDRSAASAETGRELFETLGTEMRALLEGVHPSCT